MSGVDLGGNKQKSSEPKKEKMVYLNLPSVIMFMIELDGVDASEKYINAMVSSMTQACTHVEIKGIILNMFTIKNVETFMKFHKKEYDILTKRFGISMWG